MEEETQANLEIKSVQVTKVDENTGADVDINPPTATVGGEMEIAINGGLHQTAKAGNKEEEEETALDGEFIKVERESFDVKDSSHTEEVVAKESSASVIEQTSSNSMESRDSIESNEKMKALQLELERAARELDQSELEKAQLKEDVVIATQKLAEKNKHCEDLELSQKKLHEQIRESEEKYISQLDALKEALGAQETKHKELIGMKEAFDGLTVELETSRKKMQELEQELQSSASDAHKFEELSKQSDSHAESESQKALEFQRLLEMAKCSAKEMEDQMASLQEEVKGLYEKIAENKQTEEALNSTVAELSMVRGELELSQSQVLTMEQKLASDDVVINELTLELNTRKASEEQMKGDIVALENLLSSAKEDLQVKVAKLDEIDMKLQEEVKIREEAEAIFKNREAEISSVQGELAKMIGEKAVLEAAMEDLNGNILKMKELCSDLETKLKLSDDNLCKSDSLLSQALSNNAELEEEIKSLEILHQESGTVAATATQRNLELEDIIRASSSAEDEAKSQLRDIEMRLISVEQKNIELEQQLNMAQLKNSDADRELKEYSEKTSELMALLKGVEEESAQLKMQLKEYEEKMTNMESTLNLSSRRNSELEQELNDIAQKCAEHEGRASMTHQRSLELEELIQLSHSKAEDAGKRVGEMELLLESSKYRLQELEEQISISEKKCKDVEAEAKKYSDRVSELTADLEIFQVKSSNLEISLQAANDKEEALMESLNVANEERKKYEDAAKISSQKLSETENLMEVLRNELKSAQDKLESIEKDLKASGNRESEIMEKLNSAEEQLEEQRKILEQATARSTELELLHGSLVKDSEAKLQEVMESVTQRDSDATDLRMKLKALEDQATAANEKEEALMESLNVANEERKKYEDAVKISSQKLSETENLMEVLRNELKSTQDKLESIEKDMKASSNRESEIMEKLNSAEEQLEEQRKILEQATARSTELELLHGSLVKDSEAKLREVMESVTQRDSEASDLRMKLKALEDQAIIYQAKVAEAAEREASLMAELEQSSVKLVSQVETIEELKSKVLEAEQIAGQSFSENELLVETNLKLKQELETNQIKINELQELLSAVHVEKEGIAEQLASHMNTVTELTDKHSRGLELQSAAESRIREAELQLQEAIERFTQRDSDAKDLNEKLTALETQIKISEEHANQAVATAGSRKAELEEALLKLNQLEGILGELRSKASQFETEHGGLAEANLKLTQELAAYETKMNELQTALNAVLVEKEETFEQLHSSKKTIEDLTQQLAAEGHKRQTQISSVMEENNMLTKSYQDAKEELQALMIQMERQLGEHKERENALCSDVENLKAELTEKSALQTRIGELEEQLLLATTHWEEEVENLRALAAEKEAGLISQLEGNATKLQERDVLYEQVALLQKELNLAHTTITEQKEADSRKEVDWEAALKLSQAEIEAKQQQTILLSKQVEELQQKQQLAEEKYKEKDMEDVKKVALLNADLDDLKNKLSQSAESEKKIIELENQLKLAKTKSEQDKEGIQVETKDGVEMKSRELDLGSMASTTSKRKHRKRTEARPEATSAQTAEASLARATPTTEENSLGLTIKFILGVALVSVIIGVILGKRY